jgi:hypothetical protein
MTFILGLVAGGWLFGSICFVLGSVLGYDSGARDVARVARLRAEDEAYGDVPSIDPTWRDRR